MFLRHVEKLVPQGVGHGDGTGFDSVACWLFLRRCHDAHRVSHGYLHYVMHRVNWGVKMSSFEMIMPRDEAHWLELRRQDVTSTSVSALFGACPYVTEFELWHTLRGNLSSDFEASERVEWGKALEGSIAEKLARDNGWSIERAPQYARDAKLRLGASFDFFFKDRRAVLEIKNVDSHVFRQTWVEHADGTIEPPPHIEFQVQTQMHVAQLPKAYLGVCVGGNRGVVVEMEPRAEIVEAIRARVAQFWESIEKGFEPKPVFPDDAAAIRALYADSSPGKLLELQSDSELTQLAQGYEDLRQEISRLQAIQEEKRALILQKIGDAEKVLGDGFSISAKQVKGCVVSYERKPYRGLRLTFQKASVE